MSPILLLCFCVAPRSGLVPSEVERRHQTSTHTLHCVKTIIREYSLYRQHVTLKMNLEEKCKKLTSIGLRS
ncbi:hypothetical protein F5Y07DRAFT_371896 [Xylaria sp. FL0933]|nr:hypothetical protein F5Y07DRAFT_371896 [Xylaria sp. FL0933]